MTRALNKNKKPETNNKNRACNYFLGSFGSPCSFRDLTIMRPMKPLSDYSSFIPLRSFLHHPPTKC